MKKLGLLPTSAHVKVSSVHIKPEGPDSSLVNEVFYFSDKIFLIIQVFTIHYLLMLKSSVRKKNEMIYVKLILKSIVVSLLGFYVYY